MGHPVDYFVWSDHILSMFTRKKNGNFLFLTHNAINLFINITCYDSGRLRRMAKQWSPSFDDIFLFRFSSAETKKKRLYYPEWASEIVFSGSTIELGINKNYFVSKKSTEYLETIVYCLYNIPKQNKFNSKKILVVIKWCQLVHRSDN